jgi:hypothetical protein
MSLRKKQSKFARMVADLIIHAYYLGYEITFCDAYRDPRVHGGMGERKGYGSANSCHKLRLAIDFNLFKDGVWLQGYDATKAYNELHDYWDDIGGSRRIPNDLNHFSLEHNGYI